MVEQGEKNPESQPHIVRASLDEIVVYDVTEDELDILENGSPSSQYLNFALFALSSFLSFLAVLLTVTIELDRIFMVFIVVTIVSGAAGAIFGILWFHNRVSVNKMTARIRKRKRIPEAQDSSGQQINVTTK
ncbi:MAG: hypothetical protein WCV86_03740 [Patescibacteria group bacterium]|jgi:hypothetical protein